MQIPILKNDHGNTALLTATEKYLFYLRQYKNATKTITKVAIYKEILRPLGQTIIELIKNQADIQIQNKNGTSAYNVLSQIKKNLLKADLYFSFSQFLDDLSRFTDNYSQLDSEETIL